MLIQSVLTLGSALLSLKGKYDQHGENKKEMKELQSFIEDYDHQIPILRERFQEVGGNVLGNSALMNLEKDVMKATNMLEEWSRDQSFFQLFNSIERMQKLEKLHRTIMASMQNCLGVASVSMLLDLQASQATMQASQATILESNADLKSLLITSIGSMHGTLPTKVRDEVVEASTSSFADLKFWEDVLAAVDNHNASVSLLEEKNMYEDPITTNLMIDPVVASDGNTYCRWTIIDNNLTTNPHNVDEVLTIVIDNLTFRRGLFEKFPEQAQIFRQRRNKYRSHALALEIEGRWGDAVLALHYVLQWDKHDVECVEAREQAKRALEEAKKEYLQPSTELSNEPGNGGLVTSSMHEMLLGKPVGLHLAYALFRSLSSSTPEVRQTVAYNTCHWFERDVEFQSYIFEEGGIPHLVALLPSSNEITQEHLISILLEINQSSNKWQTIFGTVGHDFSDLHFHLHNGHADALEPIAKILKEGSTKVRKQAARIFFNLSTSPNRRSIIENSLAMLALVTSLGDGTPQVQKLATQTLNNLFPDALNPIAESLKNGSTKAREQSATTLLNLSMSPYRMDVIGNFMAMLALVTSLGDESLQVQQLAIDTINNLGLDALEPIVKILRKSSTEAQEQAARIFFNFSSSPHRRSIIGNSVAMCALVTSLGHGTPQVQQLVTNTLTNFLPDALEPIAKILRKGSTQAQEQAARIFFNFSSSPHRRSIIGNSRAIRALVKSHGDGTRQVQQLVTNTLTNLLPDAFEPIAKILQNGSTEAQEQAARIFFNFSSSPHWRSIIRNSPHRRSIIGNSVAMCALVTSLGDGTPQVQQLVTNTLTNLLPDAFEPIAKILRNGSTEAQEQAARIFLNFSSSPHKESIIENFVAMLALVTSLADGTPQVQQLVTNTLNNLLPDALEPIALILWKTSRMMLRKGSTEAQEQAKAQEQAARIFFNFSSSPHKNSIFGAVEALKRARDFGTPRVQQLAADTLNNLFPGGQSITQIMKELWGDRGRARGRLRITESEDNTPPPNLNQQQEENKGLVLENNPEE